jgi:hypothetical protein
MAKLLLINLLLSIQNDPKASILKNKFAGFFIMTIRIKVAKTAQELNDVYRLRDQVYVEGEGYFKDLPGELIVDQFDCTPRMANIIAYDEETRTPEGTFRLNCDSEILLPSDEVFSFVDYRNKVNSEREEQGLPPAFMGSAEP